MKAENNESALLKGLAKNDRRAIETIYKDNYNMIQALVINNNGSSDDAKDVFQEAMIVLFEKVQSGNFELNCLIKTFVYSVSRRIWLKKLMQQNRFTITDGSETVAVDEEIEDHEKRNAEFTMMERALVGLGEPCKSLLEAFYMQRKSMQEIAANFGYTNAENAKNQKYKCLMRLRKLFFSQYKKRTVIEDIKILEAVERYISGQMSPDERVYFEQLRKTNPEVDQAVLAIATTMIACNNSGEGADNTKDSLDSIANEKKEMIDSTADQKKDAVDSITEAKKDAVEKVDSLNKADTTRK